MSEAAFRRIVDAAWAKMRAEDATVTREYVESYLRLIRQMGATKKGRA